MDLDAGQVEFFDHISRALGSGSVDENGRVTGGRLRVAALPIQAQRLAY